MHPTFRAAARAGWRYGNLAVVAALSGACGDMSEAQLAQPDASLVAPAELHALASSIDVVHEGIAAGTYTLHPQGDQSLCLDVVWGRNVEGTRVQVAKCNGGTAQQWTRAGNQWKIFGDKCLNVSSGAAKNGTRMQIWTCADGDQNSRWTARSNQLQWSKNKSFCLDVVDGATRDGTETQIWACDTKAANKNQLWRWRATTNTYKAGAKTEVAPPAKATTSTPAPAAPKTPAANKASSSALVGPSPQGLDVAPYVWTWAQWGDYPVRTLMEGVQKVALKSATVSFELSNGKCSPKGEFSSMDGDILAFRKQGGRVILSYGGATDNPPYLQKACGSAQALADVIAKQMDRYDTHNLDFDIEGANLGDTSSNNRLIDALVILQKKYADLYVSYTLPVDAYSGLPTTATALIKRSIDKAVKVSRVNLMTMDYGQMPKAGKTSADMVLGSVEASVAQLKKLYPDVPAATIYHMIGITPLIGQNDPPSSGSFYFTVSDAKTVANYSKQKGVGLLSYWGLMRDRSGTSSSNANHSNTPQKDFDFLNAFRAAQ